MVAVNAPAFLHAPLHELRLLDPDERNLRVSNVRVNAAILLGSSVESEAAVAVAVTVSDTGVEPSSFRIAIVRRSFEFAVAGVDLGVERLLRGEDLNADLLA